jgi:hypothetical protein
MGNQTFSVEFDRGLEGIRFFVETKVSAYRRGLDGLPLAAILVVTDRETRIASLSKAIGDMKGRMLFSTIESVRVHGLVGPVFHREPGDAGVSIIPGLFTDSLHEKRGCRL